METPEDAIAEGEFDQALNESLFLDSHRHICGVLTLDSAWRWHVSAGHHEPPPPFQAARAMLTAVIPSSARNSRTPCKEDVPIYVGSSTKSGDDAGGRVFKPGGESGELGAEMLLYMQAYNLLDKLQ